MMDEPEVKKKKKKTSSKKDKEKEKEKEAASPSVSKKKDKEKKKKKKKDKEGSEGGTSKSRKKKEPSNTKSTDTLVPATNKRITLVYATPAKSDTRKLIRCPAQWKELVATCTELLGQPVGSICLPPEQGSGEIDDLDLIENGDLLYIYPQTSSSSAATTTASPPQTPPSLNGKKPTDITPKKQKTPKKNTSSDDKDDSPSSPTNTLTPPSMSDDTVTPNFNTSTPHWIREFVSAPADFLGRQTKDISFSVVYQAMRELKLAYKDAGAVASPIHYMGIFSAAFDLIMNEHLNWLGDPDSSRHTAKDIMKAEEKYRAKIISAAEDFSGAQDDPFCLERLRTFVKDGLFSDVACGLNMIAGVTVDGKLVVAGPLEINHVMLGRAKPFEGSEKLALSNKSVRPIELPIKNKTVRFVACGAYHCGAITTDNHLYMWGFNINCSTLGVKGEDNKKLMSQAQPQYFQSGQLGLGEQTKKLVALPTRVQGLTGTIIQISCGGAHTLCLTSLGVYSWGLNDEGQLGHMENRFVPTIIKSLTTQKIIRVASGAHHSFALSDQGKLFSWGYNEFGQLGLETTRRIITEPTQVITFTPLKVNKEKAEEIPKIAAVSCGNLHTAVVDAGGRVFTCGSNQYGQLGRRAKKSKSFEESELPHSLRAGEIRCGLENTVVTLACGSVCITGKLAGVKMMSHSMEFRLLGDVETRGIFASLACAGQSHIAITEDVYLTRVFKLFKNACAFSDVSREEIKNCLRNTAPYYIKQIQERAVFSLCSVNPELPIITLRYNFLEFKPNALTQIIHLRNRSKKKALITVDLKYLEFPENCKLQIEPEECEIKGNKSADIKVTLVGAATEDVSSFISLNAITEKSKDAIQLFVVVIVPALNFDDLDGDSDTSRTMNYAKQHLAVLGNKKTTPQPVRDRGKSSTSLFSRGKEKEVTPPRSHVDALRNLDFSNAEVTLFERLGSGGSGAVVYRCTVNGLTCAVKILDVTDTIKETVDGFLREITILEGLGHDSIVRYLGHDLMINKIRLFMEYYPFSLSSIIKKYKTVKKMPAKEIAYIGYKIALGLEYLHGLNPPIIHRDLKPGNVLVALDEQDAVKLVKITDFDVSRELTAGQQAMTMAGTPQYAAPEVLSFNRSGYTAAVDIYSFGMLLIELITLHTPYHDEEPRAVPSLVEKGILPSIPDEIKLLPEMPPFLELMKRCLARNPSQRPPAPELVTAMKDIMKFVGSGGKT